MATKDRRTADCTPGQMTPAAGGGVRDGGRLVLSDDTDTASPGVAAALAVLAGIAASDAACCAKLRRRPRGQDHTEAIRLVRTVVPHGEDMAKDLGRLLPVKDESHLRRHAGQPDEGPPALG